MEKNFQRILNLWIERVNLGFVVFAGSLITIMAFLSTYGAIRRYAFHSPEPISYELSKVFLLLSFVLALTAVEKQDRLLRCDLLLERFPKKIQSLVLDIISPILGIVFFGVVTWVSSGDTIRSLQFGEVSLSAWPVPLFPVKLFVPLSYAFFCLVLLLRMIRGLVKLKTPSTGPENSAG